MLHDRRPQVRAAVDIGSNSVHLLVAAVDGHRLEVLTDGSVFLGLGQAVADRGVLGTEARAELAATLERYVDEARDLDAIDVALLGTEPIRRAGDASRLVREVEAARHVPLHVLSHEEEALLTLVGVTEGLPVPRDTLVVDVGGGSTEFSVIGPAGAPHVIGLRLGSATLTGRFATHDPPSVDELAAMRAAAAAAVRGAPDANPTDIVAVGGTASNLLKVLEAPVDDRVLSRARIAEAEAILTNETAAAAAQRHRLNPVRARVLPAGGAILDAVLERYAAERLRVSEASVREGAILATSHAGVAWRDRLAELAHGWRT